MNAQLTPEKLLVAINPLPGLKRTTFDGISFKKMLILQDQAHKIAQLLDAATGYFERHGLYNQLQQVNNALGLPTPPLPPATSRGSEGGDE
jgi:hypothetical protein